MVSIHEHAPMSKKRVHDLPIVSGSLAIDPPTEIARLKTWFDAKMTQALREVCAETVTLTPALAQMILARNDSNRPISPINLDRMKRDIAAGLFQLNGEPIIISRDGFLNDGQHRCRAVVETGESIRTVIVFGPDRDTRFTVDQGNIRTVGNYLSMKGFVDPNTVGAAATFVWLHRQHGMLTRSGRDRPTKTRVLEIIAAHPDIVDSVSFVSRARVSLLCSKSILAFVHWTIGHAATPKAADGFIDKLISGSGLDEGDPILYCRNRLPALKSNADPGERAELLFRAWNYHRNGEKVERINIMGKKLPKLES